ncbi:hypothetical protein ABT282_07110 [Streptomyces sp. NPDC000927]|uniref:hypothetical protein n=1 Tax=Streptomyces sp. NPDC000927 TaxID=3154371 RepID=UPI00333010AE
MLSKDSEIEPRRTEITFNITDKPHIYRGVRVLNPDEGSATPYHRDGKWLTREAAVSGFLVRKGITDAPYGFAYVPPFDEDPEDRRAPDWLIDFATACENRLNSTVPAGAIEAARQLPEVKWEDFDTTALRILRDLVPDPDALDAVLRIFNPELN